MGMSHPSASPLSSTASPDLAQLNTVITALCDMWDASVHDADATYRAELNAPRAVGIRTHAHHAVRSARALLQLDTMTQGIELIPLVRLMFECGITAAWLLVTDGSGQALIRDGAAQRRKALESAAMPSSDDQSSLEQVRRVLDELEGASSFAFEQRCLDAMSG